jgi:hypothetical protein
MTSSPATIPTRDSENGGTSLAGRVVHEFAEFLRAAAGTRELRRPFHRLLARRQFQHREAAVDAAVRIDLPGHPPIRGDEHGLELFIDPAAEDIDAGGLGLLDHGMGIDGGGGQLLVRKHHRRARKGDEVFRHAAMMRDGLDGNKRMGRPIISWHWCQ